MSYTKNVNIWNKTVTLAQDSNTVDGGDQEELNINVHCIPGNKGKIDSFIVLKTDQWALNLDEIDAFAEYLKSLFE